MTTGRTLRFAEAIFACAVAGLGIMIAGASLQMDVTSSSALIGPRLFPLLIAVSLIAVGLALLREALVGHIAHERGFELDWAPVGVISLGIVILIVALEYAGWIVAATALFVVVSRAFKSSRPMYDVLIGLALSILSFVVFSYGLGLNLPAGSLTELLWAN
jgi:putative tricarboxylic transport membrane protein